MKYGLTLFAGFLVLLSTAVPQASETGGVVQGTVRLLVDGRTFVPGSAVRLYLVTEKIAVEMDPDLERVEKFERVARLNKCHVDFFVKVREKIAQPGYLVADTLSREDGFFEFSDIPAGSYYVLVTFPTIVHGRKVAWQVPVTVKAGERVSVDLRNFNMALPAASRH